MNLLHAERLLHRALELKLPLMLWGPPGVGKSSMVAAAAKSKGLKLIDLRLAQLDAADLRGIPVPQHSQRIARWYRPSFLPEDGRGILFLDEIDKASSLVKNASLQLVLDRRLGDYRLPDGWAVVGAGNREEDNAFSTPLGAALANRMIHADIEPDIDAWTAWAKENGVSEDIAAFLRFRPGLLCRQTGENAFPSPRSWTAASKLLEAANGDRASALRLAASAVGKGAAGEFIGWRSLYRNIDPAKVLDGEVPRFSKKDASLMYAVVLAVASLAAKSPLPEKRIRNLAALMKAVTPELRVLFFKNLPHRLVAKLAVHPAMRAAATKVVMDYVGG